MKRYKLIIVFLLGIFTVFSLLADLSVITNLDKIEKVFNYHRLSTIILGIFFVYYFYKNIDLKIKLPFKILAMLFSIFLIIGYSYSKVNSWNLVFGNPLYIFISIIKFICFYKLLSITITKVYNIILNFKDIKQTKIKNFIFEKRPLLAPFIILLVCWSPYIISFYPGVMNPDSSYQIMQFLGIENKYQGYEVLLDENVTITNHHPVFHTFLLGGSTWIGEQIGNTNLGIFIYTGSQVIIMALVLAFTLYYMRKIKVPLLVRFISLLIYAIVPIFPMYSMCTVKDVMFSLFIILYCIILYDIIKNKGQQINIKKIITYIFIILMILLFRNNGLYVILLSFPFLLLIDRKNLLKLLIILIIPVVMYKSYTNVLLPALKITPGSIREVLSLPFQQTARYVKTYPKEVTKKESKIIDKILGIEDLAKRYDPQISDPVKNAYNKNATNEDLKKYFGVWFDQFLKHPNIYVEATLNNVYGYVYPDARKWYIYSNYDKRLSEEGVDYHFNSLNNSRTVLSGYAHGFQELPIAGMLVNIAFNVWLLFLMTTYLIEQKKYKYIIVLAPLLASFLICLASPVNTYYRYALPYILSMPVTLAIILNILRSEEK